MGIVGKIKYAVQKYGGSLAKDYGVYEPSKSVQTRPALPEGQRYAGTTTGGIVVTKTPTRTGGGGGVATTPSGTTVSEAEQEKKRQEEQRIESERNRAILEAKRQYQNQIRNIESIQGRTERLKQMAEEVAKANILAKTKKIQAGIITGATAFGIDITKATAPEIREAITQEKYKREVAEAIKAGKRVEYTPEGVRISKVPISEKIQIKGETFKTKLEEKYPFYKKVREKVATVSQWLEKKVPRPKLREGEKVYYRKETGTFERVLPYGMTPFQRSVGWFQIKEGKPVKIKAPTTAVGVTSQLFFKAVKVAERIPKPVQQAQLFGVPPKFRKALIEAKVEVTPELYDYPGQAALLYFFSPAISEMKAGRGAKAKQVKKVSAEKAKKVKDKVEKLLKEGLKSKKAKIKAEKKLMSELVKYAREAIKRGDDKQIVSSNLREVINYARDRGYFFPSIKPVAAKPPTPPPKIPKLPTTPPIKPTPPMDIIPPTPPTTTTIPPSIYAGLGLWERSWTPEEQFMKARMTMIEPTPKVLKQFPAFRTPTTQFEILKPDATRFKDITGITGKFQALELGVSPRVSGLTRVAPLSASAAISRLQSLSRTENRLMEKLRERLSQKERLALASRLAQIQKQKTKLELKFREGTRPRPPRIRTPAIPKPPKFPVIFKGEGIEEQKLVKSALRKIAKFKVWERRFGKWKGIGERRTLREAKLFGMQRTGTTLGASFRVTRAGKPVRLTELGGMFRPAKREAGVYVQKAKYRLSSPQEVKEIMVAKKKGGKKIKWL
jgi:hypothetical protein